MKYIFYLAFFFAIFVLANSTFAQQRWLQVRREGAGHNLNDVFFTDLKHGVAVGRSGTIVVTTDGGEHWYENTKPLTEDLYAVGFTDSLNGSMPGQNGYNFFTTDGGFTWGIAANYIPSWVGTITKEYINPYSHVGFIGGGPVIDVGSGNSWTPQTINGLRVLEGVGFANGSRGLMVDDQGLVFLSTNGGTSWGTGQQILPNPFSAIEYPQADTAFATSGPRIYRSIDSGKTWKDDSLKGVGHISSLSFYNARLGMGVSTDGKVFSTTNSGKDWKVAPTIGYPLRVRVYDPVHAVIVGGGGTITETSDFGNTWNVHVGKFSNDLLSVVCPTPNRVVLSGVGGLIAYSDDGGSRWNRVTNIPRDTYSQLRFFDSALGLAIGDSDVLRTRDGGTTWQKLPVPAARYLKSCFFFDTANFALVGDRQIFYRTTDGGDHWTTSATTVPYATIVHFSDSQHGFIMGDGNFLTSDGGRTWTQDTSNHLFAMQTDYWVTPMYGFVAGQSGIQGRTHDGGKTWKIDTIKNGGYTKSVVMTDSLNGTLVTGGDVVWHTTDGGTNWVGQFRDSVVPSGTLGLNGVAFASPEIGYAVGYNGLILKTTNGTSLGVRRNTRLAGTALEAFPNPTRGAFNLSLPSGISEAVHFTLYNELGKAVLEIQQPSEQIGDQFIKIPANHLRPGIYFYRLTVGREVFTGREQVEE